MKYAGIDNYFTLFSSVWIFVQKVVLGLIVVRHVLVKTVENVQMLMEVAHALWVG